MAKDPRSPSLSRLHEVEVLDNTAPNHRLKLVTGYIVLPLIISLQALSKVSLTLIAAIDGLQALWKGFGILMICSLYSAAPTRTSLDDLCEERPCRFSMEIYRQPLLFFGGTSVCLEGDNISIYKGRHQHLILLPLQTLCRTCWTRRCHGQWQ